MLSRFYLIVDHVDWLPRLLPLGLKLVQLRLKDRPMAEVREQISKAQKLCRQAGCQLIVNDYWQLALDLNCDYIHLGQEDLDHADLAAIRGRLKLGISTHSEDELQRARAIKPNYIALGPIYPTILKAMPWAPQGLERIGQWKAHIGSIPLVAIGGVSVERASEVYAAGADSICVVTDVLQANSPEQRLQQWLAVPHQAG